jgi:acyl-CoA reductase-like NAD-dependent aldehyde dehydrogenase
MLAPARPLTATAAPVRSHEVRRGATPADLTSALDALDDAVAGLRATSLAERIAAIDRTAAAWRVPTSPWRRQALAAIPALTGHAPAAVEMAIDHLWGALGAEDLRAVARLEGADGAAAARPGLALHVLAGNVPGAGIFGVVAALLAGVPSLVKTARREPVLPALVAQSIAAADARLGAALVVMSWPGGDPTLDAVALARAELVLAYGRDTTLDALAARRGGRLLRFGPRLSVALIARDADDDATAADAALQVALFDQQGCLSPQLVLLEARSGAACERFAAALHGALAALDRSLPPAPSTLAESAGVLRFLERQRWREQEGERVRVHGDPAGRFSVVVDDSGAWPASPLHRHVVLVPVPSLAAAAAVLHPLAGAVEAVGYAGPAQRSGEAAAVAAAARAHRFCPLARMQAPPFAWRQSGHGRLEPFLAAAGRAADDAPARP